MAAFRTLGNYTMYSNFPSQRWAYEYTRVRTRTEATTMGAAVLQHCFLCESNVRRNTLSASPLETSGRRRRHRRGVARPIHKSGLLLYCSVLFCYPHASTSHAALHYFSPAPLEPEILIYSQFALVSSQSPPADIHWVRVHSSLFLSLPSHPSRPFSSIYCSVLLIEYN